MMLLKPVLHRFSIYLRIYTVCVYNNKKNIYIYIYIEREGVQMLVFVKYWFISNGCYMVLAIHWVSTIMFDWSEGFSALSRYILGYAVIQQYKTLNTIFC